MEPFDCTQIEAALDDGSANALEPARRHAIECEECRRRIEAWEQVSKWAAGRRGQWESPDLWGRIEAGLCREPARPKLLVMPSIRVWAAVAAMLFVAVPAAWLVSRRPAARTRSSEALSADFLTARALEEVESSRAAYVQSIDKLSRLAQPALSRDDLPAMAGYRDKLLVLDQAIAEVRGAAARNHLNAQVQSQLASLYQEKQSTLQEVLSYAASKQNKL